VKTQKIRSIYSTNILHNWKTSLVVILTSIIITSKSVNCHEQVSFNQYKENTIPVASKIDLTILPKGEIYKVKHPDFVLQYFFNNLDIFGYIFKRKRNIGIKAHLCLYRSCEESKYDLKKIIAKPQEPPYDKTFFSIKFPPGLQYEFQGLEFISIK
jgi:hypothetical protein